MIIQIVLILCSSCLSAALKEDLTQVSALITNNDLQGAITYLDAHVPKPIINSIHGKIHDIEKEAGHSTNHRDFGRVAFRKIDGWDTSNEIRCAAIQIIQEFLPELHIEKSVEAEFNRLDTRDAARKNPILLKEFERQSSICRKPENATLNGFKNVLIFDASLVPLSTGRFINANFVSVMDTTFIATQAPLENSVQDFWQMVLDHKPRCIVSVNDCFDDPKLAFCPTDENGPLHLAGIQVQLKGPIVSESSPDWRLLGRAHSIKQRKLIITKGDSVHELTHFQYLNWTDGFFPCEPCVKRLIELVSACQGDSKVPFVVHCRAGVGRTGLFMVIYDKHQRIQSGLPIDIQKSVRDLRDPIHGRSPSMMQNLAQYQFAVHFLSES